MDIRILTTPAELESADAWVTECPNGNVWQSGEWKSYQESLGKKVRMYACFSDNSTIDALALVVIDTTALGLSTWDIPRGPLTSLGASPDALVKRIHDDAKKEKCLTLYLSPMTPVHANESFAPSTRHIQPQATRVIDLTKSEEEILASMHPKGRYNISLAKKHGVMVSEGSESDIDAFYALLQGTGGRDGFVISQKSHYARFLSDLRGSFLLLATHENRPIAGLLGVEWNGTAIYYYGASSYEHRSLMAPYLLQWEAIRRSKAHGCHTYDLLGISADKAPPNDPWWGISDFKRKFGGTVVTYPQEQQVVLKPIVKTALDLKRKILG